MRCVLNDQGTIDWIAPVDGYLGAHSSRRNRFRSSNPQLSTGDWDRQVHKNLTFLTVAAVAIYGVLWLLGSEGTAALGLSQEVSSQTLFRSLLVNFVCILSLWFILYARPEKWRGRVWMLNY
jgi:hypothetical protein